MKRNDIVRMAEECGGQDQRFTPETGCHGLWVIHIDGLEHFAKLVAAAEREACARIAETQWETPGTQRRTAERCAAAIRARGE
jgi:hypothetical protein